MNGGVLNFVAGASPVSGITFHGGTLQWADGNTQDISAGIAPVAAGQAAILDTNGNSVSFASSLSGSGGLTKLGGGVLTLLNTNSYSACQPSTAARCRSTTAAAPPRLALAISSSAAAESWRWIAATATR